MQNEDNEFDLFVNLQVLSCQEGCHDTEGTLVGILVREIIGIRLSSTLLLLPVATHPLIVNLLFIDTLLTRGVEE